MARKYNVSVESSQIERKGGAVQGRGGKTDGHGRLNGNDDDTNSDSRNNGDRSHGGVISSNNNDYIGFDQTEEVKSKTKVETSGGFQ